MNTDNTNNNSNALISIGDAINRTLELVEKRQELSFGIPAGFPSLDRLTRGWGAGDLVIIGARPAVGKTLLALAMARNAAVGFSVPTGYFSLELSATMLTERMISSECGISIPALHGSDKLSAGDWQQMEVVLHKLSKAPLYIDDTPGLRIGDLEGRIKAMARDYGIRLVFIDCFDLLTADDGSEFPSREKELEDNLRRLKAVAAELGVAIVLLTSVRRPVRKNYSGPVLLDLDPYCPLAEEYADKIILIHRPSFLGFIPSDSNTESFELRVVKNKNGAVGTVYLLFDREAVRLVDLDEDIIAN